MYAKHRFFRAALVLLLAVILAACERPIERDSDQETSTVETTVPPIGATTVPATEAATSSPTEEPAALDTEPAATAVVAFTPTASPSATATPIPVEPTATAEPTQTPVVAATTEPTAAVTPTRDATETPEPPPGPDAEGYYTVQPGDNLYRIGLKHGVSWVEIAEANGIVNPNQIYPGQVLKIPGSAPGTPPEFTHVVQPGESLYTISLQYNVPWLAIAQANRLTSPYFIYPGQTLIIPGG